MHLKVEVNGKKEIHSFEGKNKITIGRSPSCDIQVVAEGISRKHVDITCENGDFYVVDHGSTNGTFVNEEQIKAGEKVSFNTFFPIKLGFHVTVHLLNETDL